MRWWCSATDAPWSWTWRPYPGVWLFVALLVAGYLRLRRRAGPARAAWRGRHTAAFAGGALAVWAALDWPIGALGAGYLVSVHTVQYLLLDFVAAPLLLLGVPAEGWAHLAAGRRLGPALRFAARPLVALVVYNAAVLGTHVPPVVDGLMRAQVGSFLVDLAWIVGGLALWWPVLAPPAVAQVSPPLKIAYLFASTILPTAPAAFLTFAEYPIYSLYELAPRATGLGAHDDQQIGGLLMKLAADPVIWAAMAVIFFRWSSEEGRVQPPAVGHRPPAVTSRTPADG